MDSAKIGQRIIDERTRLGMKSIDTANTLGIHQNTFRNYESGKSDLPTSYLAKLWDAGFDAMYILTGQRIGDVAADVINNGESYVPSYHQRLVHLPDVMDINNPADALLTAMYHAEEALIQTGAIANDDYNYKDLAKIGLGLINIVK